MTKVIRKTYPRDFSIGVLIIIFSLVFFLSGYLFIKRSSPVDNFFSIYLGEFLVSTAVIIMILILWEEILFPVQIKSEDGGLVFCNHRSKLTVQVLIYLSIPAIVIFLFLTFEVNLFRFTIWAVTIMALPVLGKLVSGLKNYNDFLKLTPTFIEFKDNDHDGKFAIKDLQYLELEKDEEGFLNKLILHAKDSNPEIIKVYQMELEDFFESIEEYINTTYAALLK